MYCIIREISLLRILNLQIMQIITFSLIYVSFFQTCVSSGPHVTRCHKSQQPSRLSCHPSVSYHPYAHMILPLPVSLLYLCTGQQGTRRRGWRRTWRCRITWGSTSPRSSLEWSLGTWRRQWRTTTSPASATTAGKKSSKVCVSCELESLLGWKLKTDCLFAVLSCRASCRGGHAVQSSLLWRRWSVPEGSKSSHAELRQAVWDHGFAKRMRLLWPKQVLRRLKPSSWLFCLQYLTIVFDWMSCFYVCFLPGLLSQHKTSPAVNRRALAMWRLKDDSSSNTNKPAATCIELTGWAKLQLKKMEIPPC